MINPYKVGNIIYSLTNIYNPTALGWNPDNYASWSNIRENWKQYYSEEKRQEVAEKILSEFKIKYRGKNKPEPKDFGDYKQDLLKFKNKFIQMIKDYRYKSFYKNRFINNNRLYDAALELEDRSLANCLLDICYITSDKLTKEEVILLVETFCFCFEFIADNLTKREIDEAALTRLELPVKVEELKELILNCQSLGELFDWNKTDLGFKFWVKLYLDDPENFKLQLYGYLNDLHPELNLPVEVKKPQVDHNKLKGIYANYEQVIRTNTVTTATGAAAGNYVWVTT